MPRYAFGTTDDGSPNFYEILDLPDDGAAIAHLREIVTEVYSEPDFRIEIVRDQNDLRWANSAFEGVWEVPADYVEGEGQWLEIETRDVEYLVTIAADV